MNINHNNLGRMPNIRRELDNISRKFVEDVNYETVKQFAMQVASDNIIVEMLRNLVEIELLEERVAVWGNGGATRALFGIVKMPNNLVCVIDRQPQSSILFSSENIPVISPNQMAEYDLTTVIIPTRKYEEEIKRELHARGFQGRIIGIHTWLIEMGVVLDGNFWDFKYHEKYWIINNTYHKYMKNSGEEDAYCIIAGLLLIRDYPHVLTFIDEYDRDESDFILQNLKNQLIELFEQIRSAIFKNTKKHCMMYVIDSLNYDEMLNMPYLKEIANRNFSFESYMTQDINTIESVMSMLTGYKMIEDKLYQERFFNRSDGVLLPYLTQEHYKFNYIIDRYIYAFTKIDDMEKTYILRSAPEVFFEGLCAMLESEENTFNYMHCDVEMHEPYWNPFFEKELIRRGEDITFDEFVEQYRSSQKYMDEVMWFYYKIFEGTDVIQLILGDHGICLKHKWINTCGSHQYRSGITRYEKELINPTLIIADKNIGKGHNSNVVCNYNLAEIVKRLLEESISVEELEDLDSGYVELVGIPIYNKIYVDPFINRGDIQFVYGFVGIRTKQDIYIEREDGEKFYYVHGNKKNLIAEEGYQSKIMQYEALVDHNAIEEILKLDKFDYHKKALKNLKEDNR